MNNLDGHEVDDLVRVIRTGRVARIVRVDERGVFTRPRDDTRDLAARRDMWHENDEIESYHEE